jgi:DNA-binding XRE family transcriptional regulator
MTQPELGKLSNLGRATIVRLEQGADDLHYTTPGQIKDALAKRGITLLADEMSVGVRLKRETPLEPRAVRAEILTPEQCRAGRALLGISQRELAKIVGVNRREIEAAESGRADEQRLKRLRATLVVAGIIFDNDCHAVSVQFKLPI